jgi:transitional endoplasmic reticulum ATPase
MSASPVLATVRELRADTVKAAFDRAAADGSTLVINNEISDLLVDDGSIRDLTRVLSAHAASLGMPTLRYTLAGLIEPITAPEGPKARVPSGIGDRSPPTVAIDIIRESCLRGQTPHLVLIDFAEHLLPADQLQSAVGDTARIVEQFASLSSDTQWQRGGHRLVLSARTTLIDHRVTRMPGMTVVPLGLPQLNERREALELMTKSPRHQLSLAPGLDLDRAARLTGGVSVHALSAMRHHTSSSNPLSVSHVLDSKRVAIRQAAGDTLIIHEEPLNLETDIAGLPQIRRVLLEEQRRGSPGLRLMLAGPPGNGKSRVSTAIAAALGIPALELGRIRARYVGDSEDNLRRALDAIEANAPALLIIDEADQSGLRRRGESAGAEGSEVTANLRAALYAWLGDVGSQLGISVIGLTNRPDLLDEAATDRLAILPVLHPSAWEAAQIMAIQARREHIDFDMDSAVLALLEAQTAFSGRQAVRLLGRAQIHAQEAGRAQVHGADVAAAINESMQGIGPEEERQTLLAIRATSWAGHLPWNAARYFGDEAAHPPAYLERFVQDDGRVDHSALTERINELELRRGY